MEKTPEVNNLSKLSEGIVFDATDLVVSSEDIMISLSSLSVGFKRALSSIFQEVWKLFMIIFNIYFSLRNSREKIIVENISNFKLGF